MKQPKTWDDVLKEFAAKLEAYRRSQWPHDPGIYEIRSGAVIPSMDWPGSFLIEANTARGPRRFCPALEIDPTVDIQSYVFHPSVGIAQTTVTVDWDPLPSGSDDVLRTESAMTTAESRSQPDLSPSEVLERLRRQALPRDERRQLVFDAEAMTFTGTEASDLRTALRQYILDARNSDDPDDVIAVSSAIRKYIAVMPSDDLRSVAVLLEPGPMVPIPPDIEVEITKMVVRKLTANPPTKADSEPELAARLKELGDAYLNERLLPRDKFGAIALNVVTALAMLSSNQLSATIERLKQLQTNWFQQLVHRNARQLRDRLLRSPFAEAAVYSVAGLEQLINGLSELVSEGSRNACAATRR